MDPVSPTTKPVASVPKVPGSDVPFGVNEVRLSARQWLATAGIVFLVAVLTPRIWERIERFDIGPDYRLPYDLSKDYWLYERRLRQVNRPERIVVLGDSVVWGEYVRPDGTLSHFLNREAGTEDRFVNGGVNGLFPLALEGLVQHYGQTLRNRKVMLHCNVLWMTSPKADLSTDKEEEFNHSRLVPQFLPRIPCYRADANERLTAMIEHHVGLLGWVGHVQNAYFSGMSIPKWTLAEDGSEPSRRPNAWRNPLFHISRIVPSVPDDDPQRGPQSARHKPWSTNAAGTTQFEWVALDRSLQWQGFQRTIATLRARGNDVLVVLGPFNEHIMTEENRSAYRSIHSGIIEWLARNQVPHVVPHPLPSALYADASHPLTEGYRRLAAQIYNDAGFQVWSERQ